MLSPQSVDELFARDDPVCVQREQRQESTLFRGAECNHAAADADFQRPQQLNLQRRFEQRSASRHPPLTLAQPPPAVKGTCGSEQSEATAARWTAVASSAHLSPCDF